MERKGLVVGGGEKAGTADKSMVSGIITTKYKVLSYDILVLLIYSGKYMYLQVYSVWYF